MESVSWKGSETAVKRYKIIITASLLIIGLIFKFVLVGYSFMGYCFMATAGIIVYFDFLKRRAGRSIFRMLYNFSLAALTAFLLVFAVTEVMIVRYSLRQPKENLDIVIVLGAGVNGTEPSYSLKTRLDMAYRVLLRNGDAVCIVSGGQGENEDISEALCMYNYLTEKGIDSDRIILEDKSSTTEENVRFSLDIIESRGMTGKKIAVVTSEYHVYRARLMFEKNGYSVKGIPAKTELTVLRINYFLREVPAVWAYMLFS